MDVHVRELGCETKRNKILVQKLHSINIFIIYIDESIQEESLQEEIMQASLTNSISKLTKIIPIARLKKIIPASELINRKRL